MAEDDAGPLREAWYYALPGRELRRRATVAKIVLGEPILIGRGGDGAAFALRDLCPHRGMKLSAGHFDGGEIECCYHGWRFGTDGICTAIPSAVAAKPIDRRRIAVRTYPVREMQGNLWVYLGADPAAAPDIPLVPGFAADAAPQLTTCLSNRAGFDPTVLGLVDPAHVPFVHRAWWWRPNRSLHEKEKAFAPSPWGFTMRRHASSANSRAYRLIGGAPETEIGFSLPGVRIDHTRAGRHAIANLTAITPVDDATTEIHHCIYWTPAWLNPAKPLLGPLMRRFLRQDREVLERQQEGLRYRPPLAFIDDADTQLRWYFRLKREYRRARAEGRPFENPVRPATLRWRS